MTVSASGPTPLGQPSPTDTASFPVPQEWDVEPDRAAVRPARRLIREIMRLLGRPALGVRAPGRGAVCR